MMIRLIAFNAVLIASQASSADELYKCTAQYLVQRETRAGYSIGLANVPVKDLEPIYMLQGKKISKDEAVKYATSNFKAVLKKKANSGN